MWEGLVYSTLVISCFSGLSHSSNKLTGEISPIDTTVIAEIRQAVQIDSEHAFAILPLRVSAANVGKTNSIYLSFDSVVMTKPPEGVYEVYVSDKYPDISTLKATDSPFVHTINTYYLSRTKPGRVIMKVDRKLLKSHPDQGIFTYNILVIFRGNNLRGHLSSRQAGHLMIGTAKLLEI